MPSFLTHGPKGRSLFRTCNILRSPNKRLDGVKFRKLNGAEVSEALNSMYQYYLDAEVCYVYLSDFQLKDIQEKESYLDPKSEFRHCRWFSRGWTLQELLAPAYVVFLDHGWEKIGTKYSLRDVISAITSIPCRVLEDGDVGRFSIAQRMSWAAKRKTTKPEDQAYSLMGIFGVNMSPIYGEGGVKAFMRLQQEIIKLSDDRSIFAWIAPPGETEPRGLFAMSPYEFRASGAVSILKADFLGNKSFFSFHNNGLHIQLPLTPIKSDSKNNLFLASLSCQCEGDNTHLSIYLQRSSGDGRYFRHRPSELPCISSVKPENLQELVVIETMLCQIPTRRSPRKRARHCQVKLLPFSRSCAVADTQLYWSKHSSEWATAQEEAVCISYLDTSLTENALGFLVYPTNGSGNSSLISTKHDPTDIPRLKFEAVFKAPQLSTPNPAIMTKTSFPEVQFARLAMLLLSPIRNWFSTTSSPSEMVGHDLVLEERYFEPADRWTGSADSVLTRLKSDGFVVLDIHITAENPEVEVRYVSQEDTCIPLLRERLGEPSIWGCLVPNEVEGLNLKTVFPLDCFQTEHDKKTYISMSGQDSDVFRILTYVNDRQKEAVFVALGFCDSKPWADIGSFVDDPQQLTPEEIWKSYTDDGLRASVRRERRTTTSCSFRDGIMTVTIAERDQLQLGSHIIRIDWQRRRRSPAVDAAGVHAQ
ncbi:hypothetical protein VKT23_006568 [Stygiomarasmius scandens]|uniref:Vegetative incompatibility protein HET-E-1 n=1 Tax=Marasmiellus scandens TaxID=2682957 RepID=A0ABR1JNT9_9AGAR